jgi:uncharacterized protein YjbI with pentapeptide repeats/outer membrane protein assembly factor BamB
MARGEPEATVVNRLSWRVSASAAGASLLLATGAVAAVPASAAPRDGTVTCPTVNPKTGAVTPAPAPSVDWSGCDLTGANLTGANLVLSDLAGANLTKADLTKAGFDSADLAGANLTDANLAHVWLGSTNSTGANFTGATGVNAAFTSADLTGADFNGVKLPNALLVFTTLTSAKFANADLEGADLTGAYAAKADLVDANLTYASIASTPGGLTGNPSYNMFNGADLEGADLAHASVSGTGLAGSNLTGVTSGGLAGVASSLPTNFSEINGYLVGPYANLAGANLTDASAVNDSFAHADLIKASLANSDLASADFDSANLTGVSLKGADLTGAEMTATNATLKNVAWSAATTCPNGKSASATSGCFAEPTAAHPPTIKVSVRSGTPGTTLTLVGGGFAANESLTVSFGVNRLATVKTNGSGTVGPVTLTIPVSAQPGLHQITAAGKAKAQTAAAWFTVATSWDQERYDSGLTSDNTVENTLSPANAPKLAKKFVFNPGAGTAGSFPASIGDGAAFVASAEGPLTAISVTTGKTLWTWKEPASWGSGKTGPHDLLSQPVVVGNTAYVSVAGQGIVAVSAGKMLWQNNIEPLDEFDNAVNLSQPTLANGVLYTAEGDLVYALDAASGLQVWVAAPTGQGNPGTCGQSAVAAGVVYLSCDNGYLYALDATSGANLWSYPIPSNTEIGSIAASGGTVYVTLDSASTHELTAISTSTHAQEWSFKAAAAVNAPAIAGNVVYAVAQGGILYALNAATGALLWSKQLHDGTGERDTHGVSVADGVAYTLNANGVAYAFNADTSAQLWSYQAGKTLQATPVIANGIVYIGTRSGGVVAFAAR